MTMTVAAKAAWPLLWTECDDHGVFEWKPIVLKARIFPADAIDFSKILDEYEVLGTVKRFEEAGKSYGVVRNFARYQRPKHPSCRYPFPPALWEFGGVKRDDSGNPPPVLPPSSPRPTEKPAQMKEEGGRREEGREESSPAKIDQQDFERWYEAYPRHVGKGQAARAYLVALKKASVEVLLAGARAAAQRYAKNDPQFTPHPATWLSGERWLDEVPIGLPPRRRWQDEPEYRGVKIL